MCGLLLASHKAKAQTYTIEDLGTFPGADYSTALAVDELGQTTGWSGSSMNTPGSFPGEAFLHTGGKLIDLGTFGGIGSIGYGIATAPGKDPLDWSGNRSVLVTGWANNAQQATHAFLYKYHLLRDFGTLPGGTVSIGYAVNPSGEVAGMADEAIGYVQPVLYQHGNFISLGTLGGCCGGIANAINREGDVTGNANAPNGDAHAFLYRRGKMTDLGVLPGANYSSGVGINDSLEIAGTSGQLGSDSLHSFLWSRGKMTDLGLLPNGVNSVSPRLLPAAGEYNLSSFSWRSVWYAEFRIASCGAKTVAQTRRRNTWPSRL